MPIMAKTHMPPDSITKSFPGTMKGLPFMLNSKSGMLGTLAQSMLYCPRRLGMAPTEVAMREISEEGPVMREVPLSTMPVVAVDE